VAVRRYLRPSSLERSISGFSDPDAPRHGEVLHGPRHQEAYLVVIPAWTRAGQLDTQKVKGTPAGRIAKQRPRADLALQNGARDDQAGASADLEYVGDLELEPRRHSSECPT